MTMTAFVLLALVLVPTRVVLAQPPIGRQVADVASYVTAAVPIALDAKASWECADRARCFELQGVRLGVAYGIAFLAKTFIHEDRPCAPDCGVDRADASFFSAHTMLPFTALGGPRVAIVVPFGVSTGGLRVAAGKHWWWDTVVGAAVGLVTSRIRAGRESREP